MCLNGLIRRDGRMDAMDCETYYTAYRYDFHDGFGVGLAGWLDWVEGGRRTRDSIPCWLWLFGLISLVRIGWLEEDGRSEVG